MVRDRDAGSELAVDVQTAHRAGVDAELAGGDQDAVARRRLDGDLVERGVEVEERGAGGRLIEVVVGVGGAGDSGRGHRRGRWSGVGERAVGGGGAAGIDVVGEVLATVADDAKPVGGGVEVDPERRSGERHRELVDEGRYRGAGVDHEHAAAVSDAIQSAVLHAVVDPDQLGVVAVAAADLDSPRSRDERGAFERNRTR